MSLLLALMHEMVLCGQTAKMGVYSYAVICTLDPSLAAASTAFTCVVMCRFELGETAPQVRFVRVLHL